MTGSKNAILLAAIVAAPASAGIVGDEYSVSLLLRDDVSGDTVRQNAGPDTVTFDGVAEMIPALNSGATPTITESFMPLPDGRAILTIEITTGIGGGEFWDPTPARGDNPFTGGSIALGLDNALDLGSLSIVDLARVTLYTDQAKSLGPMDFTSAFANPWDGTVQLDFPLIAGFGINGAELKLTVSPTPATITMLGASAILCVRRRRG